MDTELGLLRLDQEEELKRLKLRCEAVKAEISGFRHVSGELNDEILKTTQTSSKLYTSEEETQVQSCSGHQTPGSTGGRATPMFNITKMRAIPFFPGPQKAKSKTALEFELEKCRNRLKEMEREAAFWRERAEGLQLEVLQCRLPSKQKCDP